MLEKLSLVNKLIGAVLLENMILVWTQVSDFKHVFFNKKNQLSKENLVIYLWAGMS